MTRHRVFDRAVTIYTFLRENLNRPYTIGDLMTATQLRDGQTTRAAIKLARGFAQDDGLCLPVACWDNGNTYCVTNVAATVIDPSIHLGKIANGLGVRKDIHDEFIRARMAKLTPMDREMVRSLEHFETAQREQRAAYGAVLKAITSVRRVAKDDPE